MDEMTPTSFNGKSYAAAAAVVPLKMHLYIRALAFVQAKTLQSLYTDCASRFLAAKPWGQGLPWRNGHRPAGDPEWIEVRVRLPADLAHAVVELARASGIAVPDVLYTMLYWYSWFLYPPLHERERRTSQRGTTQ